MNIAIIGIRGIPVTYSAFETFAQVLSTELVKKNHEVAVYARKGLVSSHRKTYQGVSIHTLPHLHGKNVSTLSHSFLSTLHACMRGTYDVILYLGPGNTVFSMIPRMFGIKTIVHIDGMDWKREKWGVLGKSYLRFSEFLTTFFPNAVITDSQFMKEYYQKTYQQDITYIPYGYFERTHAVDTKKILKKYHLTKGTYFVWVGRFVPENHIEEFLFAFKQIENRAIKCFILGDDLYESAYKKKIYEFIKEDKRIIWKGFIKHEEVLAVEAASLAYIETKRSGGTHMSLVEAMGMGSLIVSHKNKANSDVLGDAALFYEQRKNGRSLEQMLKEIIGSPQKFSEKRNLVRTRAKKLYVWKSIVHTYEKLFFAVLQ